MEKVLEYFEELYPRQGSCAERCDSLTKPLAYADVYHVRKACLAVCRDATAKSESRCVAACRDQCSGLDGDVLLFTRVCVDACKSKPDLE
jgi:hypothetical protein